MRYQQQLITFREDDITVLRALAMAERGRGNRQIRRETGLTPCMINYRLGMANKLEPDHKKGQGYRTRWRDGTSKMAVLFDRMFSIEDQMAAISKRLAPRRERVVRFAQGRIKKREKADLKIIKLRRAA